jgi:hypothetical protein
MIHGMRIGVTANVRVERDRRCAEFSEVPLGELGGPNVDDNAQEIRPETMDLVLGQELEETGEDGKVRCVWDERRTGASLKEKRGMGEGEENAHSVIEGL